eukprot:TRINITY_DN21600_c0_g1_i1.p1 TRINITY_DN21600_c0_g1~~TRINITY_DN21600_c0_g1_i1.p1  ORF type:complete len:421 (+),score=68.27 TRINITY_DN21600_c0_g1_i1:66-1265(+)
MATSSSEPSAKRQRGSGNGDSDPLEGLRTPCYVLHREVAARNAQRMRERCAKLGVKLRPHVKTHKTLEGALLQTGGSKHGIVVSTLAEARFFADGGFDDIIYAVPITPDKLKEAAELTVKLSAFHILVDNPAQVDAIIDFGPPGDATSRWSVVIMVDCGYGRDGVDPKAPESIELARQVAESKHISLAGVYTHGGHSYDAESIQQVRAIGEAERDAVASFAAQLKASASPDSALAKASAKLEVGVGSTPTSSNPPDHLQGITEAHPGNFLYYDMMQVKLGSCQVEDVAVRVCTRIVGQYQKHNTLLIDMGWTGISAQGKEYGYGAIDGHPELKIKVLKQEAGEVSSSDGSPLDFSRYPVGLILRVLPWHSCASSHQHTSVHVLDESGKPVEKWQQVRGW